MYVYMFVCACLCARIVYMRACVYMCVCVSAVTVPLLPSVAVIAKYFPL